MSAKLPPRVVNVGHVGGLDSSRSTLLVDDRDAEKGRNDGDLGRVTFCGAVAMSTALARARNPS